jgi:hypothetical protein
VRRIAAMTFATVCMLGGADPANAQELAVGLVAGFNFATLGVEDDEGADLDPRTGIGIGAHGYLQLKRELGLVAELRYSQKGAKVAVGEARETRQLDYLELPVLVRYEVPTTAAGTVEPHIAGGFALGFEVGCRFHAESGGVTVTVGCDEVGLETKGVDLGFMFQGGFDILVGPGALMLDVAYNFGITNINDVSDEGSVKNRMLYLTAGYKYPLGSI